MQTTASTLNRHCFLLITINLVSAMILLVEVLNFLIFSPLVFAQSESEACWNTSDELIPPESGFLDVGTSLTADQFGNAHLTWLRYVEDRSGVDAIFYSRWDGIRWSFPSDIVASTPNMNLGWPVIRSDSEGWLHLFWLQNADRIMHSQARIDLAELATDWSVPEPIGFATIVAAGPIDVNLDSKGIFHIVFTAKESDVYYFTWDGSNSTFPARISTVMEGEAARFPKIAINSMGKLHSVWTVFNIEAGETVRVDYASSNDSGFSWSSAIQLAENHHADPNVTVQDNNVFITWNGGVRAGGRFFQESADSGLSWADPILISRRSGQASYPTIIVDAKSEVHVLTGDGEYTKRNDAGWSEPIRFPEEGVNIEQARMALIGGNQLLAIWPNNFSGLYYTTCSLDLPGTLAPTPEQVNMTAQQNMLEDTPTAELSASPTMSIGVDSQAMPESSNAVLPFILAVAATLVVILVAMVSRKFRRGK